MSIFSTLWQFCYENNDEKKDPYYNKNSHIYRGDVQHENKKLQLIVTKSKVENYLTWDTCNPTCVLVHT